MTPHPFLRQLSSRLALAFVVLVGVETPAAAMAPPDPSGFYESFCHISQALTPVRCETLPTLPALRARLRLFAREYVPAVGDCSEGPCTPAQTLVEGQVTIPRTVSYSGSWNEDEQKCEVFPDWPRNLHYADVFDVLGEIVWYDLRSETLSSNVLSLQGDIVSDPGEWTYIPRMKFAGSVWMLPDNSASYSEKLCITLADTPTIRMSMIYDAEPVNDPPRCGPSVGFASTGCWRRLGGALPDSEGTIRGDVVSLVPTLTETDHEVHQATIVVYEQRNGTVREQLEGESDQDYLEHLVLRGRKEVARVQIERRRDGSYTFGAPGRFEIGNIPEFRFLKDLAVARWGTIWYTLEVEGAETDEQIPLEGGGFQPNRLLFRPGRAINVRPGDPDVTVGLDAFGEVGVKREIIDRLSQMCVFTYAPVEDGATLFLNNAESGGLTDELDEAIRRGVWAERATLGAADLADQLIATSLDGLATLLADLFDDVVKFHRSDIARKRDARDRLAAPVDPQAAASFHIDTQPLAKKTRQAISGTGDQQLLAQGDLASSVKKTLKGLKPTLVYWLQEAGSNDAATIAELIVKAASILADAIETRTTSGTLKSLVKAAIAEAIKTTKPLLLDGSSVSYCGVTDDSLEASVTQMSAWNSHDDAVYTKDRREVVQVITAMNREATDVLARMRAAQEVASGFDTVEDAAAAIGTVAKWVKVIEKFALVTRYVLNTESFVLPLAQAFAVLPGNVEDAVTAAYAAGSPFLVARSADAGAAAIRDLRGTAMLGNGPGTTALGNSGGAAARPPAGARLTAATGHAALVAVLASLGSALAEDRIGDVVTLVSDPDPGSYLDERDDHERSVQALFAQAGAAAGVYQLEGPLRAAAKSWLDVQVAGAQLGETLRILVVEAWSGAYEGIDDPDYRRTRDTARALAALLEDRLLTLTPKLDALRTALESNTFTSAVSLEVLAPTSNSTGESLVSASPENFTLGVRVTNLGATPLSDLSVRLEVRSDNDSMNIDGPAEQALAGALQTFDGLNGTGGDEVLLEWQGTYSGDFDWELISLSAELLQGGAEPTDISVAEARRLLPIDASVADQDGDGLPDDYEADFGLAPDSDDSRRDLDDDGILNLAELDLGTDPSEADTDEDGLDDGEEIAPGQDGFVTDPLIKDSDGDGVDDGADGNPVDGGSTTPPAPTVEPVVAVSSTLVLLTEDEPMAGLVVSNSGEGTLLWSATSDGAALVDVSPSTGDLRDGGGLLFVSVPDGFDFEAADALVATVTVTDVAGAVKDSRKVKVVIGGEVSAAVCGHGSEATIGGALTAADALAALRAAVGSVACPPCRCDVDSSGAVSVPDALRILRAAVGIEVTVSCPAC